MARAVNDPPRPARRRDERGVRRRRWLLVGGLGLGAVVLVGLWVGRERPIAAAKAPIVHAGMGTQTTAPFYLAGGTYRTLWSAWERAPEYPPCTHTAELMAVDPANGTTAQGHVVDLARFAHVPAIGATDEGYVINVKPGDYYLAVDSECAWQIAITPN